MRQYWFSIVYKNWTYFDAVGRRFGNPAEAFACAAVIEKVLAAEGVAYRGCAIQVADQDCLEVALLPVGGR